LKLPDRSNVDRWIAFDQLDRHARMLLVERLQVEQKPEASDEKMPILTMPSSDRPIAATSSPLSIC
jgi:hypothetical protein